MMLFLFVLLGFDDESPGSKAVESLWKDPDDNDSGLTEGSETEEDVGFHSDEEDIGLSGQQSSEDSVQLRYAKVNYPFFSFFHWDRRIEKN